MGSVILSIIFIGFLAINHLLCTKHCLLVSCEHGSMVELLLSVQEVPGSNRSEGTCFQFWYATIRREDSNNLVKIRVVLGVFRHAESKSSLYFVLSLFLRRYWSFFVGTLDSCKGFWNTSNFRSKLGSPISQSYALYTNHWKCNRI